MRNLFYSLGLVALAAVALFAAPAANASSVFSFPGGISASPPATSFGAGDDLTMFGFLNTGESDAISFVFTADEDMYVETLKVTGNGSTTDFPKFTISVNSSVQGADFLGAPNSFTTTPDLTASASWLPFWMTAGETVTVLLDPSSAMVQGFSSTLSAVSAVPIPAAMPLMLTAIGGVAALRVARKKKS